MGGVGPRDARRDGTVARRRPRPRTGGRRGDRRSGQRETAVETHVSGGDAEASLREAALADPKIRPQIGGRPIRKVIVVPDRLVNVVV